ncbi:hypothetical protein CDD82_4945 [Ophiocordyceps australis]|uniref:Enterotoxin n=1 Tax=Ophiocordyceps australis TaxID=1399860 RepID=A0A2C5XJ95_9HYPO|nr:hypothetical protein CDD82_4945 [Ophiocordyceps australis]
MDLQKHLSFQGQSGYISVTRSLSTAQGYAFGRRAPQQTAGYVYIISPESLPDGHWIPGLFPKDNGVQRNQEFAVPRRIPASAIAGAYQFERKRGKVVLRKWTANAAYKGGAKWTQFGHSVLACKMRFCSWAKNFFKQPVSHDGIRPDDKLHGAFSSYSVSSQSNRPAKSTTMFDPRSGEPAVNNKASNIVSGPRVTGGGKRDRNSDKKPDGSKSSRHGHGDKPLPNDKKRLSASTSSGKMKPTSNTRKARTDFKPAGRSNGPSLKDGKDSWANPSSGIKEPPRKEKKNLHRPLKSKGPDAKQDSPRKNSQGASSNSSPVKKKNRNRLRGKLRFGLQRKSPKHINTRIVSKGWVA